MDIALLANSLTVFIGLFLPYLVKMGEKAAEDVGSRFTAGAWDKAKTLWGKLQPKIVAKPTDLGSIPINFEMTKMRIYNRNFSQPFWLGCDYTG